MTYIERDNGFGRVYRFEVVDKVPADYQVWNIPLDWMNGYVPFCQCYKGTYMVNLDTLKAIKIDDYAVRKQLHDAAGLYGIYNLRRARISIKGLMYTGSEWQRACCVYMRCLRSDSALQGLHKTTRLLEICG